MLQLWPFDLRKCNGVMEQLQALSSRADHEEQNLHHRAVTPSSQQGSQPGRQGKSSTLTALTILTGTALATHKHRVEGLSKAQSPLAGTAAHTKAQHLWAHVRTVEKFACLAFETKSTSILSLLSSIELFKGVHPDELSLLAVHAIQIVVGEGEDLITEGDPAERCMYVVASGGLEAIRQGVGVVHHYDQPGQYFGEQCFVNLQLSARGASIRGGAETVHYVPILLLFLLLCHDWLFTPMTDSFCCRLQPPRRPLCCSSGAKIWSSARWSSTAYEPPPASPAAQAQNRRRAV